MKNNLPPQPPAPRRHTQRRRIKRICLCAMLTSLGVVILYCGSVLEVLELSVAALAAMLVVPVVIEYGGSYPWALYTSTTLLSLILLPQKMPAAVYLLFGYYPILKAYLEKLPRLICRILKELVFVVIEVSIVLASNLLLGVEHMPFWYNALLYALGFATLHLFDLALTRLIMLYLRRHRARISRWMN